MSRAGRAALGAACLLSIALGGCSRQAPPAAGARADDAVTTDDAGPGAAGDDTAPAPAPEPLRRLAVAVYLPSASGDGLIGELREIFETGAPGDRAKQIVNELMSGPATPETLRSLPTGTRLRQVYVAPGGIAYIDFSEDLERGIGGGSLEELLTVYSIVDSVALNIPEIKSVALLVAGQPIETLNGHVDLSRPLFPDRSWILGNATARRETAPSDPALAATPPGAAP